MVDFGLSRIWRICVRVWMCVDVSDGTSVALHAAPVQSHTHLCTSVLDKAKMKDEKIQADGGTEADAVVIEYSYVAC